MPTGGDGSDFKIPSSKERVSQEDWPFYTLFRGGHMHRLLIQASPEAQLGIHPVAMCGHEWPPFAIHTQKHAAIGQDMHTDLMGLPAPV